MSEEAKNTDTEIWRGPDEGNGAYYADSLFITASGALGIDCGGHVIVRPIKAWHDLATQSCKRDRYPQGQANAVGLVVDESPAGEAGLPKGHRT